MDKLRSVCFTVFCQGNPLYPDKLLRDHISRKFFAHLAAQFFPVGSPAIVCPQHFPSGICNTAGSFDPGHLTQSIFHFFKFDPASHDFYLEIFSAAEI